MFVRPSLLKIVLTRLSYIKRMFKNPGYALFHSKRSFIFTRQRDQTNGV